MRQGKGCEGEEKLDSATFFTVKASVALRWPRQDGYNLPSFGTHKHGIIARLEQLELNGPSRSPGPAQVPPWKARIVFQFVNFSVAASPATYFLGNTSVRLVTEVSHYFAPPPKRCGRV
eukprot:g54808.t1